MRSYENQMKLFWKYLSYEIIGTVIKFRKVFLMFICSIFQDEWDFYTLSLCPSILEYQFTNMSCPKCSTNKCWIRDIAYIIQDILTIQKQKKCEIIFFVLQFVIFKFSIYHINLDLRRMHECPVVIDWVQVLLDRFL